MLFAPLQAPACTFVPTPQSGLRMGCCPINNRAHLQDPPTTPISMATARACAKGNYNQVKSIAPRMRVSNLARRKTSSSTSSKQHLTRQLHVGSFSQGFGPVHFFQPQFCPFHPSINISALDRYPHHPFSHPSHGTPDISQRSTIHHLHSGDCSFRRDLDTQAVADPVMTTAGLTDKHSIGPPQFGTTNDLPTPCSKTP